MLSIESAKKIGIESCIEKLGRDFVHAHRDSSTFSYGSDENSVFCFVGVDDNPNRVKKDDVLILDSISVFPYRVSCNVALEDGIVSFVECVLPECCTPSAEGDRSRN